MVARELELLDSVGLSGLRMTDSTSFAEDDGEDDSKSVDVGLGVSVGVADGEESEGGVATPSCMDSTPSDASTGLAFRVVVVVLLSPDD